MKKYIMSIVFVGEMRAGFGSVHAPCMRAVGIVMILFLEYSSLL
jgi:hypothetical protein